MIAGSEMIKSLLVFQYHQNRRYNSCIIFFQGALKSFRPSLDLSMSQTYHRAISVVLWERNIFLEQSALLKCETFQLHSFSKHLQFPSTFLWNLLKVFVYSYQTTDYFKTKYCFLSESNQEKASNKLFSQKGDYFITFNWITETYRSPL